MSLLHTNETKYYRPSQMKGITLSRNNGVCQGLGSIGGEQTVGSPSRCAGYRRNGQA